MKHFIYKYAYFLLAIGFLHSCSPDLEETNPNNLDSTNFWRDLEDTSSTLSAVYGTMLSSYVLNTREEMVRSDMGWFSTARPTPNATGDLSYTFWFHNYGNDNIFVERQWAACYRGIFRANQVIEALERLREGTTDTARWTQQMAEARFFRGLFHFYLHTTYNRGEIMIEDHTPVTTDDFFKAPSSSDKVIAFFRADLQYAFDNLPAEKNATQLGRVTQASAATILGTSLLYEEEYEQAKVYFSNVIDNPNYRLFGEAATTSEDLVKMFDKANEFNSESIFEVNFDGTLRPELGRFDEESTTTRLAFLSFSVNLCFSPTAWVAHAYKTEPMDALDPRNHIDNDLANPLRSVPLRASAMVTLVEDAETPTYDQPRAAETPIAFGSNNGTNPVRLFGYYKKYLNTDETTWGFENANPQNAQKSSKNVVVNRLSEVYLMQAECLVKTGDVDGALDLINKVRARWGLVLLGTGGEFSGSRTYDGVAYNASTLMDHLMYVERPLELSAEGHATRFTDLRRWGILKSRFDELSTKDYYAQDYSYVRPSGANRTKFRSTVVETQDPAIPSSIIPNEFTIPSQNFIDGVHDYLPFPASEEARNFNAQN